MFAQLMIDENHLTRSLEVLHRCTKVAYMNTLKTFEICKAFKTLPGPTIFECIFSRTNKSLPTQLILCVSFSCSNPFFLSLHLHPQSPCWPSTGSPSFRICFHHLLQPTFLFSSKYVPRPFDLSILYFTYYGRQMFDDTLCLMKKC